MPEPNGKGFNLKQLPPWAWALAIGAGLLLGFLLLRRNASSGAQAPGIGAAPEVTGAMSGAPRENAAPADQLNPDVLAALGISLGQLSTMGDALSNIAVGAQNQLGYISTTALSGSFDLAGRSFDFASDQSGQSFDFASQVGTSSFDLVKQVLTAAGGTFQTQPQSRPNVSTTPTSTTAPAPVSSVPRTIYNDSTIWNAQYPGEQTAGVGAETWSQLQPTPTGSGQIFVGSEIYQL